MTEAPAIRVQDLRKRYRRGPEALRGVSLEVPRGTVFGLLGPNGAGKSTLIRSLLGLVRPTGGDASLLGQPWAAQAALAKVGYLPEHARFPEYLTGRQLVEFHARMVGLRGHEVAARAGVALERVGSAGYADRKLGTYSKGMKQRVGLAQAIVGGPEVLFLDEPTDGVDPVGRREIRELILDLRRKDGCTIFVNSHQLLELEQVCDRVAILVSGQIVAHGTLDELALGQASYHVEFAGGDGAAALAALGWPAHAGVHQTPAGEPVALKPGHVRLNGHDLPPVQALLDALRAQGASITRVQAVRPSLEDLYLQHTGADRASNGAKP